MLIFDAIPELDDDTEFVDGEVPSAKFRLPAADAILWPWLLRMVLNHPEYIANLKAITQVYPSTRYQRCRVHKTVNVLDKLPRGQQVSAKNILHEIRMSATKADATNFSPLRSV